MRQNQQHVVMAVLFSTQGLGVVASFCQSAHGMYAGRIVESAPTEELFRMPLHPYNASLQQSIPALHRKGDPLYTIPGAPPDLSYEIKGCPFIPRCAFAKELCETSQIDLDEPVPGHTTSCQRVLRGELGDLRLKAHAV